MGLWLLGVLLPGLPATPIVQSAAACFARTSPALHRCLFYKRLTGSMLHDWLKHRSPARRVRWVAAGSISVMVVGLVWVLRGQPWLQLVFCCWSSASEPGWCCAFRCGAERLDPKVQRNKGITPQGSARPGARPQHRDQVHRARAATTAPVHRPAGCAHPASCRAFAGRQARPATWPSPRAR